jgi:hypothetical protein
MAHLKGTKECSRRYLGRSRPEREAAGQRPWGRGVMREFEEQEGGHCGWGWTSEGAMVGLVGKAAEALGYTDL